MIDSFWIICHLQSEMNAPWSLGDWISKKRTGSKKIHLSNFLNLTLKFL